jgi:vacuolar-type H+-ATPase subunit D/Vma8
MSTFNDLFEELLEKKVVVLALNAAESETTRVSLIRKWNQYKNRMNALGFSI